MANRKDIEAGKAHVTLYAKTSPLVKGLKSVQGYFSSWGKSIMGIGAGLTALGGTITGALGGAVKWFADSGSELADWSAKTGVAATSLAELKYGAEQTGTSLDVVGKALIHMQKEGLDPKRFDEVAASIAEIPDDVTRTQAALATFGKAGAELLPMLGNIAKLRKEARDNRLVPTDEAIAAADDIGDKWDIVQKQILAGIFEIGAALAPVLLPALDMIKNIGKTVIDWIRDNQQVVITIAKIGAGLTIAGTIITAIGVAFVGVAATISGIMTVVSTIGTVLAAAFSPVGLIVIAIAAIGTGLVLAVRHWLLFTESGKKALEEIKRIFAVIAKGIAGIGDALMAGDIGLAAEIAAKALQLAFFEAIDAIIKRLGDIPKAVVMALEMTDPLGLIPKEWLDMANAGIDVAKFASDAATGQTRKELDAMREKSKAAREKATLNPDPEGPLPGSPEWYAMYEKTKARATLKSFGSFNTNALFGQKFGKLNASDDPAKKGAKALEEIKAKLFPELIKATKNNQLAYGP